MNVLNLQDLSCNFTIKKLQFSKHNLCLKRDMFMKSVSFLLLVHQHHRDCSCQDLKEKNQAEQGLFCVFTFIFVTIKLYSCKFMTLIT